MGALTYDKLINYPGCPGWVEELICLVRAEAAPEAAFLLQVQDPDEVSAWMPAFLSATFSEGSLRVAATAAGTQPAATGSDPNCCAPLPRRTGGERSPGSARVG